MNKKIKIIAEIANSHQGNSDEAINLAIAAVKSGANSIKFQIYSAEELLTYDHPRFEHFSKQAFKLDTWNNLLSEAKKLGVEVYADVFGLDAFDIAVSNQIDGIKIHSSDLMNIKLLEKVALYKGKVFLAIGGSSILEIKYALDLIMKYNNPSEIVLLHGFQAYPTEIVDSKLKRLKYLRKFFSEKILTGYSDHIDADDPYNSILPLLAIPYGISYLEKHITHNRMAKGVDYFSSLEPKEFNQFVNYVRLASEAIGFDSLGFSKAENAYRDNVKKSWVLSRNIRKGEIIEADDLIMKRTKTQNVTPQFEEIVGRKILYPLKIDEVINKGSVDHKILAVIVARSASSRLPGKAMADLAGEPAISHLLKRVIIAKDAGYLDNIAFCTTNDKSDDDLAKLVSDFPVSLYRGEIKNVLSRMMLAVNDYLDHDIVVRITGDDVLIDSYYLNQAVNHHLHTNSNYTDAKKLPGGTEVEVFDTSTLQAILELSIGGDTEYLTNYISDNPDQFNTSTLPVPEKHNLNYRLTIDTAEDYLLVNKMLKHFKLIGKNYSYSMDDIINFMEHDDEAKLLNSHIIQKTKPIEIESKLNWASYTSEPTVSVYITNYNYDKYIRDSIESVLSQSFELFELIIIDDGSSDNSKNIIKEYSNHSKVRTVFQKNKGLNATNNIALNLARGKYVMRLDADDFLHKDALLIMTNHLKKNNELVMVFPDYYEVDKDGAIINHKYRHNFSKDVKLFDQPAHGACTMVLTDVLKQLGGYSEEYSCQDGYEIWIKIIKKYKVDNVNLPLFYYRLHGKNLTSDQSNILKTRASIIRDFSNKNNMSLKNNLCIIPIRDYTEDEHLALTSFAGKKLIEIIIKQAQDSQNITKVILSTNNNDIFDYVQSLNVKNLIVDKRPNKLAKLNSPIDRTVSYLLDEYKKNLEGLDTISIINYEYPLREAKYIDNLIDVLALYEANSSLSVTEENNNFYRHIGEGLSPLSSNTNLSLERDAIYKETGGLHCVRYDSFLKTGKINSDRATHILLDSLSSKKIETKNDLDYLEYLYKSNSNMI